MQPVAMLELQDKGARGIIVYKGTPRLGKRRRVVKARAAQRALFHWQIEGSTTTSAEGYRDKVKLFPAGSAKSLVLGDWLLAGKA